MAQDGGAEFPALHGDDFGGRGNAGARGGGVHMDVEDFTALFDDEAEGIGEVDAFADLFANLPEVRTVLRVDELVTAVDDAVQGGMGLGGMEAVVQKLRPVVGLDGVERFHDVVERVGLERGFGAGAAGPEFAEVVEGFRALAQGPDGNVGIEPDEGAFGVVVDAAAQVGVVGAGAVEDLRGDGGVFEGTPGAAGFAVEFGGFGGQFVEEVGGGAQAAAGGEDFAQILGETFVDPEQIALHGLVVVGGGESGGAAVFAVPGVHELMRQKAGGDAAVVGIDQGFFVGAVVARFVVFEAEVGDVIAQGVEEMVVAEVAGAEEGLGFADQVAVVPDFGFGDAEGAFAVGGEMQVVGDGFAGAEVHRAEVGAGLDGGIDQGGERRGLEDDLVAGFALDGQRGAVAPAVRDFERGLDVELVARDAFGIQQQLIPAQDRELGSDGTAGGEAAGFGRGDEFGRDVDGGNARGDVEVELIHVDGVARPGDGFAVGRNFDADQIFDGAGGAVFARDPFRIKQREGAGLHRELHGGVQQAAGGVAGVHAEFDGGRLGEECRCQHV